MGRVVVLGSLNVDLEAKVPRHPNPGEKVVATSWSRLAGGKGGNQAIAARAAGARVVMVGAVGADSAGRSYLDRLAGKGIQLAVDRVTDAPTGHAMITTDGSGVNEIVVIPGANHRVSRRPLDPIKGLGSADILLTQLETPPSVVAEAVRQAKSWGMRVIINLAPFAELPADVLDAADPVIVHERDLAALDEGGHRPQELLVMGGGHASWNGLQVTGPLVPAEQVVDTVGAVDAFCGVLAAALSFGVDQPTALRHALEAAAKTVKHFGSQPDPAL